jgi:hypothetical protein
MKIFFVCRYICTYKGKIFLTFVIREPLKINLKLFSNLVGLADPRLSDQKCVEKTISVLPGILNLFKGVEYFPTSFEI